MAKVTLISEIPRTAKRVSPPSLRPIGDAAVTAGSLAALLIQLPPRKRTNEEPQA